MIRSELLHAMTIVQLRHDASYPKMSESFRLACKDELEAREAMQREKEKECQSSTETPME